MAKAKKEPTKKEKLQAEAKEAGLELPKSATIAELEEALAGARDTSTAGVEGRSLDEETTTPNEDQEDRGTFTKVYLVQGEGIAEDDLERYERNVRHQAIQVGLRTTGDVRLVSQETKERRRSTTTRAVFQVDVIRAASGLATEVPTVSRVATNDEAEPELQEA